MKKTLVISTLMLTIGTVLGYWLQPQIDTALHRHSNGSEALAGSKQEPLYWVAPMDPNYRRDKPGKSPMGMDLIPVYADDGAAADAPGTIKIAPEVVNNLGVRSETVSLVPLSADIRTVGYVGFDEDQEIHVHPRVEGWIEQLHVKAAGDKVTAGQPLFDLYSPALVNAQEEYVTALARGNQALIDSSAARLRALSVSPDLIRQLKRSRKVSQTVTIYAPRSGYVSELAVRQGMHIKPVNSVMSIGPLDQVWVIAEVFERQSSWVNRGDQVTISLDFAPGRQWQGEVDYIYPILDASTRTVRLRMRFDNPDEALKPNMFARVAIKSAPTEAVLALPASALIRTGSQDRVVLDLGEGRFKSVAVTPGRSADGVVEVLSGIEVGDRVVTSAQFLLDSESAISSDFLRMSPRDADKPAGADRVWAEGLITMFMADHRMATIMHQPVDAWQWPEMTMDFQFAEDLDLSGLRPGLDLHFEITRQPDGSLLITGIHLPDSADAHSDHSQHQHGGDQ